MAISWKFNDDGRVALDSVTRIATVYNSAGVQTGTRPFTAKENAAADAEAAQLVESNNRTSIETDLAAALVALRTIRDDSNPNINANPAARIKDLAKVALLLVRMMLRRFDGTA